MSGQIHGRGKAIVVTAHYLLPRYSEYICKPGSRGLQQEKWKQQNLLADEIIPLALERRNPYEPEILHGMTRFLLHL